MSLSKPLARRMRHLGAKACQIVRLANSIRKLLSGGIFHLTWVNTRHSRVGFHVFSFTIPVRHQSARLGDEVPVRFIVSEGTHPLRFAKDALQDDPGRRLAILVSRDDTDGCGWQHWCRVNGDKYAMRANSWVDLLTGTGSALTEEDLPRRCYVFENNKARYTGGLTGTAITRAIEELDVEESLALQQDHEGNLILDTPPKRTAKEGMEALQQDHKGNLILDPPPKRTAKEGMQDIGTRHDEILVLNNLTQTSKTLKRNGAFS